MIILTIIVTGIIVIAYCIYQAKLAINEFKQSVEQLLTKENN